MDGHVLTDADSLLGMGLEYPVRLRIVGVLAPGEGIRVFQIHSPRLQEYEHERWIDVAWDVEKGSRFLAGLYVMGERRGKFLAEISDAVAAADGNIVGANMSSEVSLVNCILSIEVFDLDHLNRIVQKIKKVAGVISVNRWSER